MPYKKGQSGAFHRDDPRDYNFGVLAGIAGVPEFDWDKGYDVEEELGIELRHEDQGSSLSCTGQALSSYGEVLEYIETGISLINFSPRRIYSNIYLSQGGAYLRDALKFVTKQSFLLEANLPSYKDGKPLSEQEMRDKGDLSEAVLKHAMKWQAKEYYWVTGGIDAVAMALKTGHGLYMGATGSNEGWKGGETRSPKQGEATWGHAVYGKAAKMRKGKKAIKFHNSWGKKWGLKGDGWFNEDYFKSGNVFPPYVLIDKTNLNFMKLVKSKDPSNRTVYLIDAENNRRAFYDERHFDSVVPVLGLAKRKENNNGQIDWSQVAEIDEAELIKYPLGRPMFVVD